MFRKIWIGGLLLLIAAISFPLLLINIRLYSCNGKLPQQEAYAQMQFLKKEIRENGLAADMQSYFPEGYFFTYAIYGLAWTGLAEHIPAIKEDALTEATFAYEQLNSATARAQYPAEISPPYGVFYKGWKNYLLGKIALLSGDTSVIQRWQASSDTLAHAFATSASPFLQSYKDQAWPADATVGIASLALWKNTGNDIYRCETEKWVNKVQNLLNDSASMPTHTADPVTGALQGLPRGCSSALTLLMLADVHPQTGKTQYELFRSNFFETRFGLPAIREYPAGISGPADADSGPVIFDVGFTAVIVGAGTCRRYGDTVFANALDACIESFGFPFQTGGSKKYLSGAFPMGDLFIAWTRTLQPVEEKYRVDQTQLSLFWRVPVHLLSFMGMLLLFLAGKKLLRILLQRSRFINTPAKKT